VIDVETIYAALWSQVSGVAGFANLAVLPSGATRPRLRHWSDVSAAEQPALFQSEGGLVPRYTADGRRAAMVPSWTLRADLFIYAKAANEYTSPATVLNPLIQAVCAGLDPSPTDARQYLGIPQTVRETHITNIKTDEGVLGDQAVAVISVEILAV
jgi:hypothetical protein